MAHPRGFEPLTFAFAGGAPFDNAKSEWA